MIRACRKDDLAAVVDIVKTVLTEYGFPAHVGGVEVDLNDIQLAYGGERSGFWVAEVDHAIAGTVAIRPRADLPGAACELKRLYVCKDVRGRGIGRALYAHAEAFARSAGYDRIRLDSSRRFVEARRLYEHNDFTLIEELDNSWHDNVYEKSLLR